MARVYLKKQNDENRTFSDKNNLHHYTFKTLKLNKMELSGEAKKNKVRSMKRENKLFKYSRFGSMKTLFET